MDEDEPKRQKSMSRRAAQGAAYSGTAQGLKLLIGIASTIVVARLLTPEDYGIIAMTAPITGFILIFQNLGLNQAVVQAKTLSDEQTNALFFYNMAASAAIAAILLLASPLIGLFYGDPRPSYIMAASAITVLFTGSALQHTALLNRHMRFKALSAIEMSNALGTFLFTVAFAFWLRSYWSLWLGALCGTLLSVMLAWKLDSWRPNRKIVWGSARNMVRFGANLTGFNLVNYLNRNIDNVLIAKVWGPAALGLYDRSYKLMLFPIRSINAPLSRVILPSLARVQDEPERYRRIYVLTIRALCLGSVPGVMAAAICSDELIPFLLGQRWEAASPIFFWLSLASVFQPISNATGWLFISTGRTRELFRWSLITTPLSIAGYVAGLPWGPVGVAAAFFIVSAARTPFLYWWATRASAVRAADLYGALWPTIAGGGLAWGLGLLVKDELPTAAYIAVVLAASYSFSAAMQAVTPQGRAALRQIIQLIDRSFIRTGKA